jgi:hypothetical protein
VNYLAAAALIGNRIEDNATGVVATVNSSTTGFGFVSGSGVNTISGNTLGVQLTGQMQDQLITGNTTGVSGSGIIGGATLTLANDIDNNTTGVSGFTGTIQFSSIADNGIGIEATSNLIVMHDLIYRNTTAGIDIDGVSDVRISDDTFYAAVGNNIQLSGGASNVEILNSVLWAETGTDIYVANDSQAGFFSDDNDLYAGNTGALVYWTRSFTDILDWQDDVALYDLHSVGRTAVDPTDGMPHFVDLNDDNFGLLPLVGGQNFSDAAVQIGSPIVEYDSQVPIPAIDANLLTNGGFENGLTGWTSNTSGGVASSGTQNGYPTAYDGSDYFAAGATSEGFVTQAVNLGTPVASGTDLVFGGRVRSANAFPPDQGQITVTFYGSGGTGTTALGSSTALAPNTTARWHGICGLHLHRHARDRHRLRPELPGRCVRIDRNERPGDTGRCL